MSRAYPIRVVPGVHDGSAPGGGAQNVCYPDKVYFGDIHKTKTL